MIQCWLHDILPHGLAPSGPTYLTLSLVATFHMNCSFPYLGVILHFHIAFIFEYNLQVADYFAVGSS